MRITGFRVDGFGLLHDQQVTGIGPGTTVVLGPNEAGKSTLHAFLVRTLFGHPRSNDAEGRNRHEPLHGGRHGGVVTCADEQGRWEVHRHTTGSPRLRVVGPGGAEDAGNDAALPLLGRAVDAARFEQVFAIDLDDLAGIGSLGGGALDDLLFDAATVGTGRSLRAARDDAIGRRDALWTPAATKRPLARALARRATAQDTLAAARAVARGNLDVRRRLDEASERVDTLATEQGALAARIALLERVSAVWPSWSQALDLRARLRAAPAVEEGDDPDALAMAQDVEALAEGLGAHELAVEQLAATESDLDVASRAVSVALADLGPGWDVDRVRSVAVDGPARERLASAGDELRAAVTAAADAGDAAAAAARVAARHEAAVRDAMAALPSGPDPAEVEAVEQAVAVLRRGVPALQRWPRPTDGSIMGAPPAVTTALLVAALVLLVPVAAGLLPAGVPAGLVAGLGAVLVGLGAYRLGVARRGDGPDRPDAALAADVRVAARSVGLDERPSLADVERVAAGAAADRRRLTDLAAAHRHLTQQRAEAEEAVGIARERAEIAQRRAADRVAAVTRWEAACAAVDLAPDEDVRVVLTRHERIAAARRALADREAVQQRLDRIRPRVARYRSEAAAIAAKLGHDADGRAAVRLLPGLRDRVRAARAARDERAARRAALQRDLAAAERHVDQLLGTGPRGDEGRALLRTEDPTAWEQELAAARAARAATVTARDEALAERTELEGRLRRLGGDDAVPRAEQELAAVQVEVADLVERWARADTAARLLEATVERFEREQQPRVLTRASTLLHRATGGQWAQVRRLGAQVVVARHAGGDPVPAAVLSRGTREQLWLCLRLALAEDLSRDRPLPLLVDDLLGTSDPERSLHVARVLADVARRQQVWLFTCHPRTAELVTSVDPTAGVLRLRRGGHVVGLTGGDREPTAEGPAALHLDV